MSYKYLKNKNFWTTLPKNNQSNAWSQILKCRNSGKSLIQRKFKSGNETSLWFDPWFQNDSFINMVGWDNLVICGGANANVDVIINNNQWQPDLHPITHPHKDIIIDIPLYSNAKCDYWEWLASSKGKFSFKKT